MAQVRLRTVLTLVLGGIALYFLLPRIGELRQAVDALRSVCWTRLFPALFCAALTEPSAVLSLSGALDCPLAFQPTLLVQLASTFLGRITPKGIGGVALIEHYLEHMGVERSVAVTAIATTMLASSIVHILGLIVGGVLMSATHIMAVHLLQSWPVIVILGAMIIALDIALFLYSTEARRRRGPLLTAGRAMWVFATQSCARSKVVRGRSCCECGQSLDASRVSVCLWS